MYISAYRVTSETVCNSAQYDPRIMIDVDPGRNRDPR